MARQRTIQPLLSGNLTAMTAVFVSETLFAGRRFVCSLAARPNLRRRYDRHSGHLAEDDTLRTKSSTPASGTLARNPLV